MDGHCVVSCSRIDGAGLPEPGRLFAGVTSYRVMGGRAKLQPGNRTGNEQVG